MVATPGLGGTASMASSRVSSRVSPSGPGAPSRSTDFARRWVRTLRPVGHPCKETGRRSRRGGRGSQCRPPRRILTTAWSSNGRSRGYEVGGTPSREFRAAPPPSAKHRRASHTKRDGAPRSNRGAPSRVVSGGRYLWEMRGAEGRPRQAVPGAFSRSWRQQVSDDDPTVTLSVSATPHRIVAGAELSTQPRLWCGRCSRRIAYEAGTNVLGAAGVVHSVVNAGHPLEDDDDADDPPSDVRGGPAHSHLVVLDQLPLGCPLAEPYCGQNVARLIGASGTGRLWWWASGR